MSKSSKPGGFFGKSWKLFDEIQRKLSSGKALNELREKKQNFRRLQKKVNRKDQENCGRVKRSIRNFVTNLEKFLTDPQELSEKLSKFEMGFFVED